MTDRCPCDAPLLSEAARAHGVCDFCRVTSKQRLRRPPVQDVDTEPMFDLEEQPRRLVGVPGWPDYQAQGLL